MEEENKDIVPTVNSINQQRKLSKKTKHDSKYTKISTDDSSFETVELPEIEKEPSVTDIGKEDDFQQANPIIIEKTQNFCYKKLGNTFAFFGDRDGNPLFIVGPHWPMYFCFSSLVTIGISLFFYSFWSFLHVFFKAAGVAVYLVFMSSYTYTFLINPGYPKHDLDSRTGQPRAKFLYCQRCQMWVNVEKKTNHCFDCDICVEGYDHHCPWTSKCIGRRNFNSFVVFVVSTFFIFGYIVCALTSAHSNSGKSK